VTEDVDGNKTVLELSSRLDRLKIECAVNARFPSDSSSKERAGLVVL
jgi:hypothetical protein